MSEIPSHHSFIGKYVRFYLKVPEEPCILERERGLKNVARGDCIDQELTDPPKGSMIPTYICSIKSRKTGNIVKVNSTLQRVTEVK